MKELIDKISSYNLFNVLLPGILFVTIAEEFTHYSLIQENIVVNAFIYYFIGLLISRFGSLLIEPFLKRIKFLKFADYNDFVSASRFDPKIDILSETNNMYRTFISMLILLLLLKLYEFIESIFTILKEYNLYIFIILLLIMFLYSYKKQTEYITKRIKSNKG